MSRPPKTPSKKDKPPHMDNDHSLDDITDNFELPDLEILDPNEVEIDEDAKITACIIDNPMCKAPVLYRNNEPLAERRSIALRYASGYYKRTLNPSFELVFSKKIIKDHLSLFNSELDALLTKVFKVHIPDEENPEVIRTAYALDHEYYKKFSKLFYRTIRDLQPLLIAEGLRTPPMPVWGKDGNVMEFFYDNDFEIMAIAYRTEVEQFMSLYNRVYDFFKCMPRDPDLRSYADNDGDITSIHRPKHLRPSINDNTTKSPPSKHRRASAIFGYNPQNQSQLERQLTSNNPGKPPTSSLRNLLGQMESRFQTSGNDTARNNPTTHPEAPIQPPGNPDAEDPDPSDSSDDDGSVGSFFGKNRPTSTPRRPKESLINPNRASETSPDSKSKSSPAKEPHFDIKLKPESVPKWDGNTDTLVRWLLKVNNLALMSKTIFEQLGQIVPRRLEGSAEIWYWSLPEYYRMNVEKNWDTMKEAISDFYMNRKWLDQQKGKAIRASYREPGHTKETPSDYYIRKTALLNLVWNLDDSELILEVMQGAPSTWNTILTTQLYTTAVQFQAAIRYHEDALLRLDLPIYSSPTSRDRRDDYKEYTRSREFTSRTRLVGSSPGLPAPKFPKDDLNVTKRGKTPEEKGARGCIHCGSRKHWDKECKYAFKGDKYARANLSEATTEDQEALNDYNDLYYEMDSDSEAENPGHATRTFHVEREKVDHENATEKKVEQPNKIPLNRRTRRRLARQILIHEDDESSITTTEGQLIELKRYMARPPGCSFLGAKAVETSGKIGNTDEEDMRIIMDSGSDITLISHKALGSLKTKPKIKQGQKIKLIQVTGDCTISGYVDLDVYFQTEKGPIKLTVEAYVVKGMSTPFIFGNDFADQYLISLVREEGKTRIVFGSSNRSIAVENSVGNPLMTEEGHAFKIHTSVNYIPSSFKSRKHKRELKMRTKLRRYASNNEVRASNRVVIPPGKSKRVPVTIHSKISSNSLFVERRFMTDRSGNPCIAIPDSMIDKSNPYLHVSNLGDIPFTVTTNQVVGLVKNPRAWLDQDAQYTAEDKRRMIAHAQLIQNLVQERSNNWIKSRSTITSKAQRNATENDNPEATDPLEGGPKTSEVPPFEIPKGKLLTEIDISNSLTPSQRRALETVIINNEDAFGLDGRLGNYEAKVEITMKEGTNPISLPPFPASPAKREVIDKQMDAWIALGVIEPSKSPWAAPVFIVYRNGKPRMVIDLRKFNENVVPDEFPLPKQDDILQALTGAQWLSTLDALAGFTQLTLTDSASEKLAFRTHRGLWQFKRMPFGYRNGPSVFQRVMQNVLAPYLWIFTLVYIDDIVIFSKTFEDHLLHLDRVFKAISKANITLSPPKCHFAYQSLILLGQKVSRLGLSTHKEKVDAILSIERPQNVADLQTFLGMMVYFAAYVPFYAWIAKPLFDLIKKNSNWRWEAVHEEAFLLCKEVLSNAPIRAYAKVNSPYRVYTDACDYGLAGILQQVQPIAIKDLRGTKMYDRLKHAYESHEKIPQLVNNLHKEIVDVPPVGDWGETFESTIVHVERVIAYWSRVLKSAERNYSPTEREALALKEALIKFQPFLEGEKILAITDHAALTWSKTFQNVNRRLLTWGTVFAAYPDLRIVHRAGKVHSNVDPISRLRRRVPFTQNPITDDNNVIELSTGDPLANMFDELSEHFEERLIKLATKVSDIEERENDTDSHSSIEHEISVPDQQGIDQVLKIPTTECFSILVGISQGELDTWKEDYTRDEHFSQVLESFQKGTDEFAQYHYSDNGLIYFEDALGHDRLCVPKGQRKLLMEEVHKTVSETAHAGYHKTYNKLAVNYYWPRMSRDVKLFVTSCDICQKIKPK